MTVFGTKMVIFDPKTCHPAAPGEPLIMREDRGSMEIGLGAGPGPVTRPRSMPPTAAANMLNIREDPGSVMNGAWTRDLVPWPWSGHDASRAAADRVNIREDGGSMDGCMDAGLGPVARHRSMPPTPQPIHDYSIFPAVGLTGLLHGLTSWPLGHGGRTGRRAAGRQNHRRNIVEDPMLT